MKNLFLLRGVPGSGKSTFIRNNGLEKYTLSTDRIREMFGGSEYNALGEERINMISDKQTFGTLNSMLEFRLNRGLTTIIDATNIKAKYVNNYSRLAASYGYKTYVVDFTGVPISECIRRNNMRTYNKVPEKVIETMYKNAQEAGDFKNCEVINIDKFKSLISPETQKLDFYNKFTFIGDIHACCDQLKEFFNDGINEKTLYVFTGDYIDRGPKNIETLLYLCELSKHNNFIFLEGNHERWLRDWTIDNIEDIKSRQFAEVTKKELDKYFKPMIYDKKYKNAILLKEYLGIINFVDNLREFAYLEKNGIKFFVCHGGVSNISERIGLMGSKDLIRGSGNYSDDETVDQSFFDNLKNNNVILVHGHRKSNFLSPIQVNDNVFNLEGGIERGGFLNSVTFDFSNPEKMEPDTSFKQVKGSEYFKEG